ncbi:uncharacterized protein V1510DRAFT_416185 [Dipodascopsis tothii]|uniref:uncharacterized protein n=1 Tax=Dipodascopsis tothii TaxID=44089 RepID=UPI0034CEF524
MFYQTVLVRCLWLAATFTVLQAAGCRRWPGKRVKHATASAFAASGSDRYRRRARGELRRPPRPGLIWPTRLRGPPRFRRGTAGRKARARAQIAAGSVRLRPARRARARAARGLTDVTRDPSVLLLGSTRPIRLHHLQHHVVV